MSSNYKKDDEQYVKVCPNCGSTNIIFSGYNTNIYDSCTDCGLHKNDNGIIPKGSFANFLEVKVSELENFRKEIKKRPILKYWIKKSIYLWKNTVFFMLES